MGTYLLPPSADAPRICQAWAVSRPNRFSQLRADVTRDVPPGEHGHILTLTVELPQTIRSLCVLPVVASLVCYEYLLIQLPYAATHFAYTANHQATVSWVAVPQATLAAVTITGAAPSLILRGIRAALDRRERRLVGNLRESVPPVTLMPPQNWGLFQGDAACLLYGAGILLALHCMIWFSWLGKPGLILPLVLPYAVLMLAGLVVTTVRNASIRTAAGSLDTRLMLRLNRLLLAGRTGYFFTFPLVFYALASIAEGISYALLQAPHIPWSLPRVPGNSLSISGGFVISVGDPAMQGQQQFDQYLATSVLAPRSLALAVSGVVLVAIVMYLSVPRYWTLAGISSASGENRPDRAAVQALAPARGKHTVRLQWALLTVINLLGTYVIVIIALWAGHLYVNGPNLERFIVVPMSALTWYQTAVSSLLGQARGSALAYALLAALTLPGALWLVMWGQALGRRIWQLARLLGPASPAPDGGRLSSIRAETRTISGGRVPPIRVDQQLQYPKTEALLPMTSCCVIRLPRGCIGNLTDPQLLSVVAHETAHARKHARSLWLCELLSWMSLTGPGLLTLMLDYPAMEFQADEMAVTWTGDDAAAIEALTKFRSSTSRGFRQAIRPRRHAWLGRSITRAGRAFFSFSGIHPGEEVVSFQARKERIEAHAAHCERTGAEG